MDEHLKLSFSTFDDLPAKRMGMFDVDGEDVYVVFGTPTGDMEFSSLDALKVYLNESHFPCGEFVWVTDNEPVEIDCIDWVDGDVITGTYYIRIPKSKRFILKTWP